MIGAGLGDSPVAPDRTADALDDPLAQVDSGGAALIVNLEVWEGPLDLLLDLARRQKVDLRTISILALVDQYLAFVEQHREALAQAADYLVMAARLAYLKSALLLPRQADEEPDAEELAARLRLRLRRLAAMREAGDQLFARKLQGRDVFVRPAPEGLRLAPSTRFDLGLADLLSAYGAARLRTRPAVHTVAPRAVMTLEAALERVSALLATSTRWRPLDAFLPPRLRMAGADPRLARSARASCFVAALELARQGEAELAQDAPFAPLRLRARAV